MRPFHSTLRFLAVLGVASGIFSGSARAAVPSSANSTVPPCYAACPQGDLSYTVVIRDIAGFPIAGSHVVLEFANCPAVHRCPAAPAPYEFVSPTAYGMITDVQGRAVFPLQIGGTCAGAMSVSADGILMTDGTNHGLVSVSNTDQNGDLFVVAATDGPVLAAKGPADPTADLDCDGDHDAADAAVLTAHDGHVCPGFIDPVLPGTWGRLKVRYR
ncbi:MAG TPA: hypothetical protein VL123_07570 [Candidatus Udaeobacter sp.]|jgi:hypothetical protein|nr:hypothetical protein [Candidatus Udaeobacter sp.]